MDSSAELIIEKCGGVKAVAEMLGLDLASIHKWKYPRERGGTGGRVPTGRQRELLDRAREAGINLTPEDFFAESDKGEASPAQPDESRQSPSVEAANDGSSSGAAA